MKNSILLIITAIVLILSACKAAKTPETSMDKKEEIVLEESKPHTKLIEMAKGACHGMCPIYSLAIYNDGVAEFNGKRFCEKLGPFKAQISDFELDLLKQKVSNLGIEKHPDKIESMIPDFPSTKITCYKADNTSKSVWWRDGAPAELSEMAVTLDKFRTDLQWDLDTEAPLPKGAIENELLIQLKDGVEAKEFAKLFSDYDLLPAKQLMPDQPYWLYKFDTEKISGYELLNLIYKSKKTHNAEFNKAVEQRN